MNNGLILEKVEKNKPLYPISIVAELIGITEQTLRIYEKHGLISPARRSKNRFYSENDIEWIGCLRHLIHDKKLSIEGIKKLLEYAPCWEIKGCSDEKRDKCAAYINNVKPCWELNNSICDMEPNHSCENCTVYVSKSLKQ